MYSSQLDFSMISKALSVTMEALKSDLQPEELALEELMKAQKEFQQALLFSIIK